MPRLTAEQLTELGDRFLGLAQALGNYRMERRASLSKAENQQLRDLHWTLLNYADDFYSTSAALVMDQAQPSLRVLRQVTAQINRTLKNLRRVQSVIDVAAAAATLGASIFSKNPKAILDALAALEKSWKAANK